MTNLTEIFNAIIRERNYQDLKYGHNPHTVGEWLLIIESELNEAKKAKEGVNYALAELLQVASVCIACMQEHGVKERE